MGRECSATSSTAGFIPLTTETDFGSPLVAAAGRARARVREAIFEALDRFFQRRHLTTRRICGEGGVAGESHRITIHGKMGR